MRKFWTDVSEWLTFSVLVVMAMLVVQTSYAQEITKKNITVNFRNEQLSTALKSVEKLSGYIMLFTYGDVQQHRVTTSIKGATIIQAMDSLLKGKPLSYTIKDNYVTVTFKKPTSIQKKLVGGVVSDIKGNPLPGVAVVSKSNANIGTATTAEGKFALDVASGDILLFSFLGMKSREVIYKGQGQISVAMEEDVTQTEEIVITGMNKRSKESYTGGYVTVDVEKLKTYSPNNLLKGLQYFDPSFHVVENNRQGDDPNAVMEFNIRGDASIGGVQPDKMNILLDESAALPNTPLFVLDGFIVPMSRINDLDQERVKSITILKDAAATAIYGSRATNGVVVVDTKPSENGQLNIQYATNITIQSPDLSDYNLLNSMEKLELEMKAGVFKTPSEMNTYYDYLREAQGGVNTYWLSQPLRTAIVQRHSLSMSGGSDALRYSMGVNMSLSPGVMKGSEKNSKGVNFNIQYRHGSWNIMAGVTITDAKGNDTPYGSFSEYGAINPYYRVRDENGNYLKRLDMKQLGAGEGAGIRSVYNPLYNTQFNQKNQTKNLNLANNLTVEFAPVENFRISALLSYNRGVVEMDNFKSASHTIFDNEQDLTKRGSYEKQTGSSSAWSASLNMNYNKVVEDHLFSFMLNGTFDESTSSFMKVMGKGFPSDKMDDILFANEIDRRVGGTETTTRSLGTTAQVSYMYDYRYAVDLNIRGDISSRFGADNKFAPFWSAGAKWNMHYEDWMPKSVSDMVIRASYGVTGSQNYAPYEAIEFYTYDEMMRPYEGFPMLGSKMKTLGNPELGWSTTNSFTLSFEAGFLDGRINGSVNYYNNLTKELLIPNTLAPSTGFSSISKNVGEIENKGVDVFLSFIPHRNVAKKIQWTVSVNANHNMNKIKKISNSLKALNDSLLMNSDAPIPIYREGYSTQEMYLVQSLGINPENGREIFLTRDGHKTYIWNADQKIPVGNTEPILSGNINSSLNYGNFTLSLGFSFRIGEKMFNQTLMNKVENSDLSKNVDRRALTERWTTPGEATRFKGYDRGGSNTEASTRFLMTLNEFRFNTVSLGYRFSAVDFPALKKAHIPAISISAGTSDMLRFATVQDERGLDYPFTRSYNFSFSILFF